MKKEKLTPKRALYLSVAFFVYFLAVIIPMISLQGCSTNSPLFSTRNDKASLIIEKPPTRIIISGEYSNIDTDRIIEVMKELRKHPYHNYKFSDTIYVNSEHVTTHKDNWESKAE